jgi:hypothetical protein
MASSQRISLELTGPEATALHALLASVLTNGDDFYADFDLRALARVDRKLSPDG